MKKLVILALLALAPLPARGVKITEFPITGAQPVAITTGPDGLLWFVEDAGSKLGRIATDGNGLVETALPVAGSHPNAVVTLSTGGATGSNFVGVSESLTGTFRAYSINAGFQPPTSSLNAPRDAALGPDGRVWITEYLSSSIYALHWLPGSPASVRYTLPLANQVPWAITAAADRVWFTEQGGSQNHIGYCTMDGSCTELPTPTAVSHPRGITVHPNGTIWFAEQGNGATNSQIGRYDPATNTFTEFVIPGILIAYPVEIVVGPDGNLWFTESANKIGRMTPAGVLTEYPAAGTPYGMTLGPDGNLWYTEYDGNKIARLQVSVPGDVSGDGSVNVSDVFYLINFLFAGGPAPK